MTGKIRIQEVIVVEGKKDTLRLNQVVIADTIETIGSSVSEDVLMRIELAQEKRGVIIFTDPDFSGEKIRKKVAEVVPQAKHAFISREEGKPNFKGSLGVEHASEDAILHALKNVMTPMIGEENNDFPIDCLIKYNLLGGDLAKKRREQLGDMLGIGYTNGKQLKKRLKLFSISLDEFEQVMKQIIQEENKS